MWILHLNNMRSPKAEILTAVAKAETKEVLLAFLDREKVLAYSNGQWLKTFRLGGPLEWFNPPYNLDCPHLVEMGLIDAKSPSLLSRNCTNSIPICRKVRNCRI